MNTRPGDEHQNGGILGGVNPQPGGRTRDGSFTSALLDHLAHEDQKYTDMLGRQQRGPDGDKPLFAYVGFEFPHTPVLPPAEFREKFQKLTYKIPDFTDEELAAFPPQLVKLHNNSQSDHFTDEEKHQMVAEYYAFCAYGDSLVGQVADGFIDFSEQQGRPWMILYVCGDHGWRLNEHGMVSKFSHYDTDLHNPIIVVSSDKKKFPAGMVVEDFTCFVDMAPTLLTAGGIDVSASKYEYLDGRDLIKTASGVLPPREYVIAEPTWVIGPRAVIRTKDYKFAMKIRSRSGHTMTAATAGKDFMWAVTADLKAIEPTLFDLRSDPDEVDNVAFDPKYRPVLDVLRCKLQDIVLGDGRVEVAWTKAGGDKVHLSNYAPGADDGRIDLPAQTLSKEGEEQKEIHDFLFNTFGEGRKAVYVGAGRDRGLKQVTILEETREIRHGDELLLPEGAERVAALFRHFAFHGADLHRIKEVRVLPFSPDQAPPRSAQVNDFYRVQMPSLPLTDEPYERMTIRFLMKEMDAVCRIDDLVFIAQKQISPEFDSIPYRDLGSEFPRDRVEIRIDTDHELAIGGTSELQRDRWFRMHETPGVVHESFENWAAERGILPGRGAFKFNPALTHSWGGQETLEERKDKPGAADLTFFDRYDAGLRNRKAIPLFREQPFAMCFNDWPAFMSVPLVGRGTPLVDHFDDAAELAAAFVADQIKDSGYTATWWEVKNESSVQSEWAHHWKESQGIDGWGLLADFHNRVADAVHARAPEVNVGGPSSAYMQLQVQDFDLFRNQARFIEETRGHLDFFSHHFYENALMLGAHERRGLGYSNYLLGRYEAILDMLRAHMHKVDNVLPILITECGSLQNGRKPSDNWLRLYAWNAYLTKSMQRPDQIDLFVPFIFLHMSWNPNSGDAAFTPKADQERHTSMEDFEPTTVARYFDLWRDFDGRRLPVAFDRNWLDVVAVHDGGRISLAVTNMGGRQLAVDLAGVAQRTGATRATQTRLNYHEGEVVFEPEHTVDAAAVPVDVNETTVIRLVLDKPLAPTGTLRQDRWYAAETAVAGGGEPVSFDVRIDDIEEVRSARLVVGVHRHGGVTEPLSATVNGTPVNIETGDANEFTEFFAPLDAFVPLSALRADNTVEIKTQSGATITSVQLVTQHAAE